MTSRIPPSRRSPEFAVQRAAKVLGQQTPGAGRVAGASRQGVSQAVAAAIRGRAADECCADGVLGVSDIYLLTTFGGDTADAVGTQQLYVYTSADGKDWHGTGQPVFGPSTGLRDPSVLYHNGYYYIAYTASIVYSSTYGTFPPTTSFPIVRTSDFVTFTTIATVDCTAATAAVGGAARTWAPEWFVDSNGDVYIYIAINDQAIYWTKATNSGLTAWTTPAAVTGYSTTNAIDPFVIKIGSTYHLFVKNETSKYIDHATSSSPTSGYTTIQTGNWPGWTAAVGAGYEGQCVIALPGGGYRIYVDDIGSGAGMCYADTTDVTLQTFGALTPLTLYGSTVGLFFRHGTVLRTSAAIASGIQSASLYGALRASARAGVQAYRTSDLTPIARNGVSGVYTTREFIPWQASYYDTNGFWSSGSNPGRFTVPAGMGGRYRARGIATLNNWAANNVGALSIFVNGSEVAAELRTIAVAGWAALATERELVLAVGDYVEFGIDQRSANTQTLVGDAIVTNASLTAL